MSVAGRVYHRVYCRFLGRVAFINAFPDREAADALTLRLTKLYGSQGAKFWPGTEDTEASATWGPLRNRLRDLLRAAEPPRLSAEAWAWSLTQPHNLPPNDGNEGRHLKTAEPPLKAKGDRYVRAVPDEAVAEFVAAGRAIIRLKPGRARLLSIRKAQRRR